MQSPALFVGFVDVSDYVLLKREDFPGFAVITASERQEGLDEVDDRVSLGWDSYLTGQDPVAQSSIASPTWSLPPRTSAMDS